ncbi:MAG: VWA domain-containing protein [Vicinamibacterales bacterium]
MRFAAPGYLPLLTVPALLTLLWVWQAVRRLGDRRRYLTRQTGPVRTTVPLFGDLLFWLCLILALSSVILALARPQAVVTAIRTAGVDLVILQDGSASMRVADVRGDRWKRSIEFMRTLAEALRWKEDRVALALFAHIATPQIRLTRDPNTFFFFLDHLEDEPPFRLEDDSTWDTNIERGIYWGLRLIQKDEEIHGVSPNGRAFVLVSDGQAWSGEVESALTSAEDAGVPVYVVGVGTTAGGMIPEPANVDPAEAVNIRSSIDRNSLSVIANAGGGRYFELGRERDVEIANAIIDQTRRRAMTTGLQEATEDLYWRFLLAALALAGAGALFLRDRTALGLQLAAAAGVLALISSLG